jgi:hypothetical protein
LMFLLFAESHNCAIILTYVRVNVHILCCHAIALLLYFYCLYIHECAKLPNCSLNIVGFRKVLADQARCCRNEDKK